MSTLIATIILTALYYTIEWGEYCGQFIQILNLISMKILSFNFMAKLIIRNHTEYMLKFVLHLSSKSIKSHLRLEMLYSLYNQRAFSECKSTFKFKG